MALVIDDSWKRQPKRPLINESMNLRKAVESLEASRGETQSLPDLCRSHNVKRRVLYDFTSMMEKFGCCSRVNNERFLWNGLDSAKSALKQLEERCENTKFDQAMRASLNCDKDSSLPHIGEAIMTLFFFLKVPTLNIREICHYLTRASGKYHTMLRKVYTVASRLEVGGLIVRTNNSAEIKLFNDRVGEKRSIRLSDMINTERELKMEGVFAQRRKEFVGEGEKSSGSGSTTPQPSSPESALGTCSGQSGE